MIMIGETIEPFGEVIAIGFVGERYYWLKDKYGSISMIDAITLEKMVANEKN